MDLIQLTQKLVSIPSYVNKETDEGQMGTFIFDYLQELGTFCVKKQPVKGGRFNVIAHDGSPPRLLFCCHMDTVVPSKGGWQHDLYAGQVEGDRLYGLGACDMKGGTACLLHTLQAFPQTQGLFLLFDVDEEYDFKGMRKFLKEYEVRPELAVFPEPGLRIANRHRGLIEVSFRVRGRSAHASQPDKGRNAILGASHAVEHLLERLKAYEHPTLGKTACNLAWLEGGIDRDKGRVKCQPNAIPDMAKAVLDIRPARPELRAQTVIDLLTEHLRANDFQVEKATVKHDFGSLYVPSERLTRFEEVVQSILGRVEYGELGGYGEGQLLNERLGVDCVYFGPGPMTGHEPDEYVSVTELSQAAQVYTRLVQQFCVQ